MGWNPLFFFFFFFDDLLISLPSHLILSPPVSVLFSRAATIASFSMFPLLLVSSSILSAGWKRVEATPKSHVTLATGHTQCLYRHLQTRSLHRHATNGRLLLFHRPETARQPTEETTPSCLVCQAWAVTVFVARMTVSEQRTLYLNIYDLWLITVAK